MTPISSSQPTSKKMKRSGGGNNSKMEENDGYSLISLHDMPEDLLRHVAQYLPAPDILRLLCVHPHIHKCCGSSFAFWNMLTRAHSIDGDDDDDDDGNYDKDDGADDEAIRGSILTSTTTRNRPESNQNNDFIRTDDDGDNESIHTAAAVAAAKRKFLLQAYTTLLPRVRWIPVSNRHEIDPRVPDSREGHLACALGTKERPIYVFHGGFTDDANVYCCYKPEMNATAAASAAGTSTAAAFASSIRDDANNSPSTTTAAAAATWLQLNPSYSPPNVTPAFVYGASFTRLDERRAVRFGGFQSGGYTGETNQVAVLTVDLEQQQQQDGGPMAHWEVISIQSGVMAQARAYHTATLLHDRYLLVVGGMTSGGSIVQEALLDTHTWQWLNVNVSVSTFGANAPSGRHGHSLVLDARRNRFVLFGGGSGIDLLRSGTDNTEVWELNMGEFGSTLWKRDLLASLPWRWNQLYTNSNEQQPAASETNANQPDAAAAGVAAPPATNATATIPPSPLSLVESLCLGRCHVAFRVSPDSVVFCFGSGRPSTNGVLAYDLRTNTFLKPRLEGPLPRPRFTAASVLFEEEGYVLVHGGYSTQMGDTSHEFAVLDLAPAMQRSFDWLPLREHDDSAMRHPPVTVADVQRGWQTVQQGMDVGIMMRNLTEMTPEMRQRMALQYMGAAGLEAHNANLLRIVIGAHAAQIPARQHDIHQLMDSLQQHMEENDDDDDDDDDYDDEDDDEDFDEEDEGDDDQMTDEH